MTAELINFLLARLDEDALWATEASRNGYNVAQDGVHWRWVANDTDTEIAPDPSREMTIGEEAEEAVSLRSREEWTTASGVGPLPQFALYADEVLSTVGGHIIRHDPARVLGEVNAKRRILHLHSDATGHNCSIADEAGYELNYAEVDGSEACTTLRLLALPYADHPDYRDDYREEWRP